MPPVLPQKEHRIAAKIKTKIFFPRFKKILHKTILLLLKIFWNFEGFFFLNSLVGAVNKFSLTQFTTM